LREGIGKEKCVGKCVRLSRWRELKVVFYPPVPIERVRLCEIRQGGSCLFVISEKHVVWRGE